MQDPVNADLVAVRHVSLIDEDAALKILQRSNNQYKPKDNFIFNFPILSTEQTQMFSMLATVLLSDWSPGWIRWSGPDRTEMSGFGVGSGQQAAGCDT